MPYQGSYGVTEPGNGEGQPAAAGQPAGDAADEAAVCGLLTLLRMSRVMERVDAGVSPQQYRMLELIGAGGERSARLAEIAQAAEESGVPVTRITEDGLGELLSIFPLTVAVQRIALEAAESLGVNPDTFGRNLRDMLACQLADEC